MLLSNKNKAAFNSLEHAYLFNIPETEGEKEYFCPHCGKKITDQNTLGELWDGKKVCQDCAKWFLQIGEITREEYEEVYGNI